MIEIDVHLFLLVLFATAFDTMYSSVSEFKLLYM